MKFFRFFFIVFIMLLFQQCGLFEKKHNEEPLARVYNDYLYLSDVVDIIPYEFSSEDSLQILNNFINNWIHNKLVLHTAEKNLHPEQKNFEKQLTEYRNSLVIYTYESELVRQKLDTIVSEQDIVEYYNNNQQNFLLKDNIVKVTYVKTPLKTSNLNKIRNLYKSENEDDLALLRDISEREAVNYFLEDAWLVFSDITKEIPLKTYNEEEFLKRNKTIHMQDSLYNYFLHIKGFRIKESISPLSLERDNIKNIIINKRKIELIKKIRTDIFNDAVKSSSFEIFVN